ncbi:YifB family Mg chelatase-like AAA ATPase [Trueperella pecoris]|uniref:YifB family Mg chelatase-like AAA ATPase n=1 Tax=Trueperella pecoris TaxID=2733571 RepID=UPI001ABE8F55|nr:YifB family Mg chelatase-like AAA ATPase [Trueperella pecoris]QTG76099.1 YifB family Mg chelatase-like AAA ATPase [Trueperella pecoris]
MNTAVAVAGTVGRAKTLSIVGLEAIPILVEAVQLNGLPSFQIVGLPDAAVNEARERLRAGFHALGVSWPNRRLTVNLSPADVLKSGTGFDLAIAVAILGSIGFDAGRNAVVMGELGLDGSIRPVRGVLPALLSAVKEGVETAIVPVGNREEALLVDGIEVVAVHHLAQVARLCGVPGQFVPPMMSQVSDPLPLPEPVADLSDVYGQEEAILALEVAAAGGHHMLMVGSPGIGKSMLARRMPGIMPDLTHAEALEVAAISSLMGERFTDLPHCPPFSAPHHTASAAAMVGGGSGIPRPGAVTFAHRGVLFCDEYPEFAPRVIQALRQPMEDGYIELARSKANVRFPARFQLVAAANPCRCGHVLDAPSRCTCTSRDRRTYNASLGGPVRDRIDIQILLRRPSKADLRRGGTITSAQVKARVSEARLRQAHRLKKLPLERNAQVPGAWLRRHTPLSPVTATRFEEGITMGELSLRGYDRILRLAWSIADVNGRGVPSDDDVALAYTMRGRVSA